MSTLSCSTPPALAQAAERDARQRASASVQAWLAASHPQGSVHALHTLQGPAQGHAVFACAVGIADASAAPPARRQIIAKCLPDSTFAATARCTTRVWQLIQAAGTRVLGMPAVLHVDALRQVLLLEPARGELLAALPASEPARLIDAVARCSAALHELHQLPTVGLLQAFGDPVIGECGGRTGMDAQLAELMRPHPSDLAAGLVKQAPASSRQLQQLVGRLQEAGAPCSDVAPCLVHRDSHPRQMFVGAARVDLIDWDLCGLGDPALDLANLHLHIDLRWPQLADQLHACVTSSYGASADVHRRLPLYLAFHHLRRACKAWRQAGGDLSTPGPAGPWLASAAAHLTDFQEGRAPVHGGVPRAVPSAVPSAVRSAVPSAVPSAAHKGWQPQAASADTLEHPS
ncbi:MAG: hypothetical protein RLZZ584_1049 [Pseudomonadota bacterium]